MTDSRPCAHVHEGQHGVGGILNPRCLAPQADMIHDADSRPPLRTGGHRYEPLERRALALGSVTAVEVHAIRTALALADSCVRSGEKPTGRYTRLMRHAWKVLGRLRDETHPSQARARGSLNE